MLHWGADPRPLPPAELAAMRADLGVGATSRDEPVTLSILPGEPEGWSGRPGLAGHRDGGISFHRLVLSSCTVTPDGATSEGAATEILIHAADNEAGVRLTCWIPLEPSGVLRIRHEVTNSGPGEYTVDSLTALLPAPDQATELLDLTGRSPQPRPARIGPRRPSGECTTRPRRSTGSLGGRIRLPGLDPAARYQLVRRDEAGLARSTSECRRTGGTRAGPPLAVRCWSGSACPALYPGQAMVLHLRAL